MTLFKHARSVRPLLAASTLAIIASGAANASNTLTEAGTSVSNTFTLDYDVGTVSQPTITNDSVSPPPGAVVQGTPTLFTVDRKVDHVVTATNSTLSTAPGSTATLTFELLNEGNDNQAYSFSVDDLDSGAGTFDATSVTITYYIDTDDDGDFSDETGTVISETTIGAGSGSAFVTGDVPKGVSVLVEVDGTVDPATPDAETDDITLVAEARDPTAWIVEASATPAAVTAASGGANSVTGSAQNVLADDTGVAAVEGDSDGLYAVTGIIEVASPDLTATKSIVAISEDNTTCATKPAEADAKAIPGACIEYLITVTNTGATASATNLLIEDILPAEVTFVGATLDTTTTTGFADDGAVAGTGPTLTVPGTPAEIDCNGTTTCVVQLSDAILAAGEDGLIRIRAEVK